MYRSLQKKIAVMLAAAGCSATMLTPCCADSLWQNREPRRANLVQDSRARYIGDLITIIISQSTEVDNREDKGLRKTTGASARFDLNTSTGGDLGTSDATGAFDASNESERSFSGQASYRNSREFMDRITVRVVGIDEVGNMMIEGSRGTHISGEHRVLKISGSVRKVDIGPDNTLNSLYISDIHLVYEDGGTEGKFTRQGWLSRKMNKIWPF